MIRRYIRAELRYNGSTTVDIPYTPDDDVALERIMKAAEEELGNVEYTIDSIEEFEEVDEEDGEFY